VGSQENVPDLGEIPQNKFSEIPARRFGWGCVKWRWNSRTSLRFAYVMRKLEECAAGGGTKRGEFSPLYKFPYGDDLHFPPCCTGTSMAAGSMGCLVARPGLPREEGFSSADAIFGTVCQTFQKRGLRAP